MKYLATVHTRSESTSLPAGDKHVPCNFRDVVIDACLCVGSSLIRYLPTLMLLRQLNSMITSQQAPRPSAERDNQHCARYFSLASSNNSHSTLARPSITQTTYNYPNSTYLPQRNFNLQLHATSRTQTCLQSVSTTLPALPRTRADRATTQYPQNAQPAHR